MPTLARIGGQPGTPGVVAMPNRRIGAPRSALDPFQRARPFRSAPFSTKNAVVTGVTRDSTGNPLAGCTVQLFRTIDDSYLGEAVSNASGNYSVFAPGSGPFYVVAYKAGAPDVAGTTVNTLVASNA